MQPFDSADRLEDLAALDPIGEPLFAWVTATVPAKIRDALHGVWLGHPLHPVLVQVPVGAWTSSAVLDWLPGTSRASRTLVGLGLLSALPAAAAGLVDLSTQHEQQRRVGLVHAAANVLGIGLYLRSYALRRGGSPVRARGYGLAGITAVSVGGWLGGHLAYRLAAGANHTEDVPHRVEPGWHDVCALAELTEGTPVQKMLGEVPLFVLRHGDDAYVLADTCSHLSGPLHEGTLQDGCIVCPWHQSAFELDSGAVARGPATAPQPTFQTRVSDGRLHVMLPGAG